MAQNKTSVNLSSADFVLSFSFKGRSVVVPGQDQNFFGSTGAWGGATPQKGVDIPQVYYCENVVPTAEGYRSVAFKYAVPGLDTGDSIVKILSVFDGAGNSGLIGVTDSLRLYVVSMSTGGLWQELTFPAGYSWTVPSQVTSTTVIGFIGLCVQGVGIFRVNLVTSSLEEQVFTGIDPEAINGICASNSIMIAWDDTTVYWSSALDPFDFVPSLITGAGSAIPESLKGRIVLCKEIKGGFIVYSEVTIIGAQYTQNNAIPWIFEGLEGSAGIVNDGQVGYDTNLTAHFAWTTAGLVQIEVNSLQLMFPQVTDFIASCLIDVTGGFTAYPRTEFQPAKREIRVAAISARYLCISFGYLLGGSETQLKIPVMQQSFLYDSQLRRWGKLNVEHSQILEAPFSAETAVFF